MDEKIRNAIQSIKLYLGGKEADCAACACLNDSCPFCQGQPFSVEDLCDKIEYYIESQCPRG